MALYAVYERAEDHRRRALNAIQGLRKSLTVAAIKLQIVAPRFSCVESDGFADDEGDGLSFTFSHVT